MKEVFVMTRDANVTVIKIQCLDAETKRDNTVRKYIPNNYRYSAPQSPITS